MLQAPRPALRSAVIVAGTSGKGFGRATQTKPVPAKDRKPGSGAPARRRQTQFIEDEEQQRAQPSQVSALQPVNRSSDAAQREAAQRLRNSVESQRSGQGGSDSDFDRRLSKLAQRVPQQPAAEQRQPPAEQRDVLAMSPQFMQPAASPAADDSSDDRPSWLVQAGSAGFALVLLAIFALVSVAGGGGAPPSGSSGTAPELSEQQRKELQSQAQRFDEQLAASPGSVEALEGAAVTRAKLGDLTQATSLLQRLTKSKGQDPEVWRLLAETQSLQGDLSAAAAAYEIANAKAGGGDIELLSAWTDALLAAGKPQKAVEAVKAAKQKSSDAGLAVDLDLLLGRVFSQWKGHNGEALALYDSLAEANPNDFRPVLAKSLVLKREGRKGDAARYAMQARYLAPASARQAVEELVQQ